MRLIDADALIGQYNKFALTAQTDYAEGVRDVINDINNAPSIDIVKCKDCKHRYDDGWKEPRWTCDYLKDMRLKDDDFCSYGVRKGADDE